MSFEGVDPDTIALMIELQLSDVRCLIKGKGREDEETPDGDSAMTAYKEEPEALARFEADRAMCQTIAAVPQQNCSVIRPRINAEDQAVHRSQHASGSSTRHNRQGNNPTRSTQDAKHTPGPNRRTIDESNAAPGPSRPTNNIPRKPAATNVRDDERKTSESSSRTTSRKGESAFGDLFWLEDTSQPATSASEDAAEKCIACGEAVGSSKSARCPCSHSYCYGCLGELLQAATTDESLFPPRCCKQQIPIEPNKAHLPPNILIEFEAKEAEYGTKNRTYCHEAACSAFIPSACIAGDTATCPECAIQTCASCKGPPHANECPEDNATQEFLRIAKQNGWKHCCACRRMIELDTGCNQITCLCGAQFCYVCGVPWKECECSWWNEDNLFRRANVIVDRHDHNPPVVPARRGKLVKQERQHLVKNHECAHKKWTNRSGKHFCEECRQLLFVFIFECSKCGVLACRQCRFNRL